MIIICIGAKHRRRIRGSVDLYIANRATLVVLETLLSAHVKSQTSQVIYTPRQVEYSLTWLN